jgi:hypothetical protein
VTASPTGGGISFTWYYADSALVPTAKNLYYLSGKLGELDAPSEWFLDSTTSALYLWASASWWKSNTVS